MYNILDTALENKDNSHFKMIFAVKNERTIPFHSELEEFDDKYDNFDIKYIAEDPEGPHTWYYFAGHINKTVLERSIPPPGPNTMILT